MFGSALQLKTRFYVYCRPMSSSTSCSRRTIVKRVLLFQCTKQKTWKDIAAQLGIGASSSGAYTLKKHYGKNLLPFECYYDRGGIDPGPILAQVSGGCTVSVYLTHS